MKVTLRQILESYETIQKLAQREIPFMTSFNLSRNLIKMNPELAAAQNTQGSIFKKYGEQKGDRWYIKPENEEAASQELNRLMITEVEIDIQPINPNDLKDLKIKPADLLPLMFLFDEDVEKVPEPIPPKSESKKGGQDDIP